MDENKNEIFWIRAHEGLKIKNPFAEVPPMEKPRPIHYHHQCDDDHSLFGNGGGFIVAFVIVYSLYLMFT